MGKRYVAVVLLLLGTACSANPHANTKYGFVNQSINQMDSNHWYVGGEAIVAPWGRGQYIMDIPIPRGSTITRFQGTVSWRTTGCGGPALGGLIDRNPAEYTRPPVMYPLIIKSQKSEAANLWFDYSVPLTVENGMRFELGAIPEGSNCDGDFEVQGIVETR